MPQHNGCYQSGPNHKTQLEGSTLWHRQLFPNGYSMKIQKYCLQCFSKAPLTPMKLIKTGIFWGKASRTRKIISITPLVPLWRSTFLFSFYQDYKAWKSWDKTGRDHLLLFDVFPLVASGTSYLRLSLQSCMADINFASIWIGGHTLGYSPNRTAGSLVPLELLQVPYTLHLIICSVPRTGRHTSKAECMKLCYQSRPSISTVCFNWQQVSRVWGFSYHLLSDPFN